MPRRGKKDAQSAEDWLLEPAGGRSDGPETGPEDEVADEGGSTEPRTGGGGLGPEVTQWLVDSNGGSNGRSTERARWEGARPATDSQLKMQRAEQAIAEKITRFEETLDEQQLRIADLEEQLERREAELAETVRERDEAIKARGPAVGVGVDERWEKREAVLKERLSKRFEKREAELNKGFEQRQIELERQLEELEEQVDIREAEVREQATQRERELSSRIEELESTLAEAQQRAIAKPARRPSPMKGGKLNLNEATFEQLRDLGLSVTLSARTISYRDSRGGFESMAELDEVPGLSTELKRVLRGQLKLG